MKEKTKQLTIAIVAAEVSGDMLGGQLIAAIKKIHPNVSFVGIAGPNMQAQGCHSLASIETLSVMGIWELVSRLPAILRIRRKVTQYFLHQRPDIYIGIDAPDFNLPIEKKLKKKHIPVIHYNSPTVWAWRPGRIKTIKQATDVVLTLFPFEHAYYQKYHHPACFVGHPLADQIPLDVDKLAARREMKIPTNKKVIALLPGSRMSELKYMGKIFIETAAWCYQRRQDIEFILPVVNEQCHQFLQQLIEKSTDELPIKLLSGSSKLAFSAADVALVKSGTATLEALLLKCPMVVTYVTSTVSYYIARALIKLDHIALPNILSGESLVPELLQAQATPERLGKALLSQIEQNHLADHLQQAYTRIHLALRRDASQQAAKSVLHLLANRS